MTAVRSRHDLADLPVSAAVTTRGKELSATDTIAEARRLFARSSVQVLPVLDGTAYAGTVSRDAIRDDHHPHTPVVAVASRSLPTALAPPAKGDHTPGEIVNRKQQPVAEHVVAALAVLATLAEPGSNQLRVGVAL